MKRTYLKRGSKGSSWPNWFGPRRITKVNAGEPLLYPCIQNKGPMWGYKWDRKMVGTYVVLPRPEPFVLIGS